MNITGKLTGDDKVIFKLQSLPNRLQEELTKAMKRITSQLVNYIQKEKLSGQVLHRRTGTLSRSISNQVTADETGVFGIVHSRAGGVPVVYAAIQEYGGTIHREAREQTIYNRISAAGDFKQGFVRKSRSNFARDVHVGAHDIVIPARSYLRSSLAENQTMIQDEINAATKKATQ